MDFQGRWSYNSGRSENDFQVSKGNIIIIFKLLLNEEQQIRFVWSIPYIQTA